MVTTTTVTTTVTTTMVTATGNNRSQKSWWYFQDAQNVKCENKTIEKHKGVKLKVLMKKKTNQSHLVRVKMSWINKQRFNEVFNALKILWYYAQSIEQRDESKQRHWFHTAVYMLYVICCFFTRINLGLWLYQINIHICNCYIYIK